MIGAFILNLTWRMQFLCQGIYETKVPLDFNAIVQLGCVCKVDKTAKKRSLQEPWNLSELHMKTTTECAYLEQSISFFYLYQR
jgi:DNA polymerase epsilon subunit 1